MKNNLKRILSVLVASMMLVSFATACNNTTDKDDSSSSKDDTSSSSKDDSSSEEEDTPVEAPTVKMIAVGTGMPTNYTSWQEKTNAYLEENYNLKADVEIVSWADWDSRRSVVVNTGAEGYDLVFTNNNTFLSDVNLGVFADITDKIEPNMPGVMELYPSYMWEAVTVGGSVYGVPTYKDISSSEYIVYDVAMLEAVDMVEEAKNIHSLTDLTPIVKAVSEHLGGPSYPIHQNAGQMQLHYTLERFITNEIPVVLDKTSQTVLCALEAPVIVEQLNTIHEWYEAGYVNSDAAVLGESQHYKPISLSTGWSTAAQTVWGPQMNCEAVAYQYGESVVGTASILGSANCVTAGSKNQDAALQLLEVLNTDTYARDLFFYGEEGVNWDYTDAGRVHKNNTDWTMAGYTQATFFNVTPTDDVEINQWDEVKVLNEGAEASPILGFSFDSTGLENQVANVVEVWGRWQSEVYTGTLDPKEVLPQVIEELNAAGMQDIIEAGQTQVDAFIAAK